MKRKKCFVLIVSKYFPKKHLRAGQLTHFINKMGVDQKIHTIRSNYPLWKKRIDQINSGEAYLSIREWSGKPYASKQVEIMRFEKLGVEKITSLNNFCGVEIYKEVDDSIDNHYIYIEKATLATNDGLTLDDFNDWFRNSEKLHDGAKLKDDMGIIHFTDFRYGK